MGNLISYAVEMCGETSQAHNYVSCGLHDMRVLQKDQECLKSIACTIRKLLAKGQTQSKHEGTLVDGFRPESDHWQKRTTCKSISQGELKGVTFSFIEPSS